MITVILQMAVAMATTILREVIKNPASVKTEGTIIADLAMLSTQADTAVNGTVWTSAPAAATKK